KAVAFYYKFKGTSYDGEMKEPIKAEWFIQGYDKSRSVLFDEDGKVTEVEILNGKDGWDKVGDQSAEHETDEQLDEIRENIYLNWIMMLVPLKGKEFRLTAADETSVGDHRAVGLTVERDKHASITLYFDKETNLLVKYERKLKHEGHEYHEVGIASDYRDVQGTKQSFKLEVSWDGAKHADFVATEMKLHEKPLDDKLFEKP
ncbi:MAG TPA: hypothetical protein VGH32_11715, partial [Pirellulales bacterium]